MLARMHWFFSDQKGDVTFKGSLACLSQPIFAEGCGRNGDAELARFLQIAMGLASELEYHTLLAHDTGLLSNASYEQLSLDTTEVK